MDLTTRYLGLTLKNPLIASASPLTSDLGNLRRLEDYGAAAVVLPSIFEEQIEAEEAETERLTTFRGESFPEALSYFPPAVQYSIGAQAYLEKLRRAREAIAIPVIASLNGVSRTGWCDYARLVEQAGANAIELNAYFVPSDLSLTGAEVENLYLHVVKAVKSAVSIPVAVKLSPYFSAPGWMAMQLAKAGADGLVLFNRFYQPDIDLMALGLKRDIELSRSAEIRLPLLWICAVAAATQRCPARPPMTRPTGRPCHTCSVSRTNRSIDVRRLLFIVVMLLTACSALSALLMAANVPASRRRPASKHGTIRLVILILARLAISSTKLSRTWKHLRAGRMANARSFRRDCATAATIPPIRCLRGSRRGRSRTPRRVRRFAAALTGSARR